MSCQLDPQVQPWLNLETKYQTFPNENPFQVVICTLPAGHLHSFSMGSHDILDEHMKYSEISWDLICNFDCCHFATDSWMEISETWENMSNPSIVNTVSDCGLGLDGAGASAWNVMIKFRSCISTSLQLEGLKAVNKSHSHNAYDIHCMVLDPLKSGESGQGL